MKKGKVSRDLGYRVIQKSRGKCGVCKKEIRNDGEIHHIVGRGVEATEDNLIYLCRDCHRGTNGVHKNADLMNSLRIDLQKIYFDQGKTEEEARALMGGKLYLDSDGEHQWSRNE